MQIYNLDECGISTVHKPGRVITELNHEYVGSYFWRKGENTHNPNMCFGIRAGNSSDDDFSKEAFE